MSGQAASAVVGVGSRAVLYLRQSVAREESISLELQETAGREYCERHGYTVVAVKADPGISGRTWNRPAVQEVMGLVESGDVDVVVLWKWSRLSRSRLDWAVAADRVETAGGRIESATEPIDTSTATGRFARGMLTEFAAFESERIGDVWRETHARRTKAGLPANGKPRFGYTYSREGGFEVDPLTGPVLRDTYRRYIAGASIYELVKRLNDGPTRPVGGYGQASDGLWSDRTLRRVLDSGFGAGLIAVKGEKLPGAHEALITPGEWDAYLEARGRRRTYRRSERSEYLLSGLVWCACGSKMNAGQFGHARTPKYRCRAAHQKRTHAGGYVTETVLNDAVRAWLADQRDRLQAATAARLEAEQQVAVLDPTPRLSSRLSEIIAKQDRLADKLVADEIPADTYQRMRDKYTREREILETELRSVRRRRGAEVTVLPVVIDRWDDLELATKREMLRALIDQIIVTPARPRSLVRIVPATGT